MTQKLTIETINEAVVGTSAAFRCRRRLQPAGGPGDKIFPPAFAGAVYAIERRRLPDREEPATCVLLDSVQSQANRMELALQDAVDAGEIKIPLVKVNSSEHDPTGDVEGDLEAGCLIDRISKITSLQVPHRLADAIFTDSKLDGQPFRHTEVVGNSAERYEDYRARGVRQDPLAIGKNVPAVRNEDKSLRKGAKQTQGKKSSPAL